MINDRIKNGRLLPFVVDMYRGRSLALSHFPSSYGGGNGGNDNSNSSSNNNSNNNSNNDSTLISNQNNFNYDSSYKNDMSKNDNTNKNNNNNNNNSINKNRNLISWKSCLKVGDEIYIDKMKFKIKDSALPTGE